jgi:hypothetical protein
MMPKKPYGSSNSRAAWAWLSGEIRAKAAQAKRDSTVMSPLPIECAGPPVRFFCVSLSMPKNPMNANLAYHDTNTGNLASLGAGFDRRFVSAVPTLHPFDDTVGREKLRWV